MTVVDKMVKQPGTKHHGTMEKLKQCFPRSEAHRRVLATTEQPRQRCCRPRGRRARTASSRRIQATKVGWLSAQGIGEAGIGFVEMATALGRRRELDGAAVVVTGKQRRKKNDDDGVSILITRLRSSRKPRRSHFHASATPRTATTCLERRRRSPAV